MKKRITKIISILLVIALCFGTFGYAFAYSTIKKMSAEVELLQDGSFDIPTEYIDYSKSSKYVSFQSVDTAQEFIYQSLLKCESRINVYSYRISINDILVIFADVVNNHPDLFYVTSSIESTYTQSGYVYEIVPFYATELGEIENAKAVFENGVRKALSLVDDSMNDIQKCLVIHDYLCDIATYPNVFDESGYSTLDKDIYHSAYGMFYDGNVVCAGYTLAYSYILNRLGIETKHIASRALQHAWNKVKINGNWYNVDLTYDDITYKGYGSNTRSAMMHNCFMKSDTAFSGEIGEYHYGGKCVGDAPANDTSLDDYFWNGIDTFIPVIDGNYYYLSLTSPQYLYKRTTYGDETKLGTSGFSTQKVTFKANIADENGTTHTVQNVDYLNRLIILDNRFYINSYSAIYSYPLINGAYKKYTIVSGLSDYIVGLGIENNQLVYQYYSDDSINTLDKLEYFENNITIPNSNRYNSYADINLDLKVNAKDYAIIKSTKWSESRQT